MQHDGVRWLWLRLSDRHSCAEQNERGEHRMGMWVFHDVDYLKPSLVILSAGVVREANDAGVEGPRYC